MDNRYLSEKIKYAMTLYHAGESTARSLDTGSATTVEGIVASIDDYYDILADLKALGVMDQLSLKMSLQGFVHGIKIRPKK